MNRPASHLSFQTARERGVVRLLRDAPCETGWPDTLLELANSGEQWRTTVSKQ